MNRLPIRVLQGMIVGAAMLVPGVSGGTMAILLGCYDELLCAVASFFRCPKQHFATLASFGLGASAGILLFARAMFSLVQRYPMVMLFFFFGAAAGGIPTLLEQAKIKKFSPSCLFFPAMGALALFCVGLLPQGALSWSDTGGSWLFLAFAGVIVSVALVLPGISASYLMLVLGLYEPLLAAVRSFDLLFLLVLGCGILAGTLLCAGLLSAALKCFPTQSYLVILGFVVGSLVPAFPGMPGSSQIVFSLLAFMAGVALIRTLDRLFSRFSQGKRASSS